MPDHRMRATRDTYTWIQKYIFPGGFLPSTRLITDTVARGTGLRVTERFPMGEHYAHTLRLWQERFDGYTDRVSALGFDPVYQRMWRFYPAYTAAEFRSGYLDAEQFVLSRLDEV